VTAGSGMLVAHGYAGYPADSRETEYATGPTPEMVLPSRERAGPLMDRDQLLFTLAATSSSL